VLLSEPKSDTVPEEWIAHTIFQYLPCPRNNLSAPFQQIPQD
jgi:hypothetical protein